MGRIFTPDGLLFSPAGIAMDPSCCCDRGCSWGVSATGTACSSLSPGCFGGVTPLKVSVTLALTGDPAYTCPGCYFGCNTGAVCMVGGDQTAFNGTWTLTQDATHPCRWTYSAASGPLTVRYYPGSPNCSDPDVTPADYGAFTMTLDLGTGEFILNLPVGGNDHYIFYSGDVAASGCDPSTCTFSGTGTYPFFCLTARGNATFTGA